MSVQVTISTFLQPILHCFLHFALNQIWSVHSVLLVYLAEDKIQLSVHVHKLTLLTWLKMEVEEENFSIQVFHINFWVNINHINYSSKMDICI